VALRVADIERSAAFYAEVLEAERLISAFVREGPAAEEIVGGPAGVRFRTCHLGLGEVTLELVEFTSPRVPAEPLHPSRGNLVHFGVYVPDFDRALARVRPAGGRLLWQHVRSILGTDRRVMFIADPDENVVELLDADVSETVEALRAASASIPPSAPTGLRT
jgi:catechol 2,3-dioxygenase-like lactoylglutathione lyase family enzyme